VGFLSPLVAFMGPPRWKLPLPAALPVLTAGNKPKELALMKHPSTKSTAEASLNLVGAITTSYVYFTVFYPKEKDKHQSNGG